MKKNLELLEKLVKKFNKFETTYGKYDLSNYILENKIELESRLAYFKKKIELGMDLEKEINNVISKSFTTGQAKQEVIQNFYMDMFIYRIILLEEYNINYYEIYSSLLHNILTFVYKHKKDEEINIRNIIALSINMQKVLENLLLQDIFNKIKF